MNQAERWARAKDETHGIRDWKRGVATAMVAGVCSIAVIALFGPENAEMTEALVIGGSILGAYILRPMAELAWNYLWGPWRALNEKVTIVAARGAPTPGDNASSEEKRRRFQALRSRLMLLREVEEELRLLRKSASKALESGYGTRFHWKHPVWDELKNQLAGVQDMQTLYEELRDCIDQLDDVPMHDIGWGRLTEDGKDRLQAGVPLLDQALKVVEREISRLIAIKWPQSSSVAAPCSH